MIFDRLIEKIVERQNPTCVGLDTDFSYLPTDTQNSCKNAADMAQAITEFNKKIIDEIFDIVPAVKVQIAYYEVLGAAGIQAFCDTMNYAKSKGLFTIADAKRNDIGSTATAYAKAFLTAGAAMEADFLTVNGYLGSDGLAPFINECAAHDKGIFVLVKTSNPSSDELQNIETKSGKKIYQIMAEKVTEMGSKLRGSFGYSAVGSVVGATQGAVTGEMRKSHPHTFFLVPGYGAQGADAEQLKNCFDEHGIGAIVNSSRGIICAYKQEKYKGLTPEKAARMAAIDMKKDLEKVVCYGTNNIK